MQNNKEMILFNSKSILGGFTMEAAEIRNWKIHKIKESYKSSQSPQKIIFEIKEKIVDCIGDNLSNCNLTWVSPEFDVTQNANENYFSHILLPVFISTSFSELCNKNSKNSINFIGRTYGLDFIEGFENLFNSENKLNNLVFSSLSVINHSSITPLTKYLALQLGKYNINVNAAAFGPINNIDKKDIVENYRKKSINYMDLDKSSIIGGLDLLFDNTNEYMTGQIIKFDGGASIC